MSSLVLLALSDLGPPLAIFVPVPTLRLGAPLAGLDAVLGHPGVLGTFTELSPCLAVSERRRSQNPVTVK